MVEFALIVGVGVLFMVSGRLRTALAFAVTVVFAALQVLLNGGSADASVDDGFDVDGGD